MRPSQAHKLVPDLTRVAAIEVQLSGLPVPSLRIGVAKAVDTVAACGTQTARHPAQTYTKVSGSPASPHKFPADPF